MRCERGGRSAPTQGWWRQGHPAPASAPHEPPVHHPGRTGITKGVTKRGFGVLCKSMLREESEIENRKSAKMQLTKKFESNVLLGVVDQPKTRNFGHNQRALQCPIFLHASIVGSMNLYEVVQRVRVSGRPGPVPGSVGHARLQHNFRRRRAAVHREGAGREDRRVRDPRLSGDEGAVTQPCSHGSPERKLC